MQTKPFSIRARLLSFKFAVDGLRRFFREEHNARVHGVATILVVIAARFFSVTLNEWIALLLATGFVWSAEIFNTAIEKIMDRESTAYDRQIGYIKDLAAAAVLIAAITAICIGSIVFIPKLNSLW